MKNLLAYLRPSDMSFEIYTDKIGESGRNIIRQAYQEACSLNHHVLAPEHVLIAYAKIERAKFEMLMSKLNLEEQVVQQALSARLGEGYRADEAMKISEEVRAMLASALKHARENGRVRIEAIDILTGLFADARNFPGSLFERLGVDYKTVTNHIRDIDASQ
jgi:ATP-dependent Clp protease ATP-binding subunit ClpA